MGRGVCLSVCPMPQHNSRTDRPRKPKFGRMEAHHTRGQKVKSQSQGGLMLTQYMPNIFRTGRHTKFKLGTQTERKDPHQRQAPWPSRSKVKVARSHDASDRCWPISRERNVLETPKLVGRLSTPRVIMHTSFKAKGQRSISSGRLMLIPEVRHIFRTKRRTNFKLGVQMEDEDSCRRDGPSPARSKVKVAMSRCTSDRCSSISLEWKVPETSKLVSRLRMPRAITRTSFNVKRWKVKLDYCWHKSVSYLPIGRLRNFKTGTPIEHALYQVQLPRPAIKAYEVGFLHAGGGIPCRPHPAATLFVCVRVDCSLLSVFLVLFVRLYFIINNSYLRLRPLGHVQFR